MFVTLSISKLKLLHEAIINPFPAKLSYLIFQPIKVVSRYRDPKLQVCDNYSHLFNFKPNVDV